MFEYLPPISEASYKTFVEKELLRVLNNINDYMAGLRSSNKYLAQAIGTGATTVAEGFEGETNEIVKADAVAAQLVVLRLVGRELEARTLEEHLLNQSTK